MSTPDLEWLDTSWPERMLAGLLRREAAVSVGDASPHAEGTTVRTGHVHREHADHPYLLTSILRW